MPTDSLFSFSILTSVGLQIMIMSIFQISLFLILKKQSWFTALIPYDNRNIECEENSALYIFSLTQYIYVILTLTIGKPFRKAVYTNIGL